MRTLKDLKRSEIWQEIEWDSTYNIAFLGKNHPERQHEMTRRYLQSSKIKQNFLGQKSKQKNGHQFAMGMAIKPSKRILSDLQSTACPSAGENVSFSLHMDGNLQVRDSKAPPKSRGTIWTSANDRRIKPQNPVGQWLSMGGWADNEKSLWLQLCSRERNGQICSKKTAYHEDLLSHWEKEESIWRKSHCSSNLLIRLINTFSLWLIGKS